VYDDRVERSAELRVPTLAVPVRVALIGQRATEVELFIHDIPRAAHSQVLDDVAALLDEHESFVPIRNAGDVRLLGKLAVQWIAVHRKSELADDDSSEVLELYDRQHHVEVEMIAGQKLSGTLLDSAPADRPRVVDHLNQTGQFVRLWTADEHYLINKAQILQVTELPEQGQGAE